VTCQNEGTCVVEAGLAVCYCKGDYSGATCSGNVIKSDTILIVCTYKHLCQKMKSLTHNYCILEVTIL
jgi:hypothetical protein